jgi:hypothetical protein
VHAANQGALQPCQPLDPTASQSFHDVTIVPFSELLDEPTGGSNHRGGPAWPAFDDQVLARHCRGGLPIDSEPACDGPAPGVAGAVAWGGPIVRHYGHQLADFAMRLLHTVALRPDLPVVFATKPQYGIDTFSKAPAFVGAILDWLQVPEDRRLLVTEPTRAAEIVVFPQAEQIQGPGPQTTTLDALDGLTDHHLGRRSRSETGTIYVSRAGIRTRFAGEGYVEEVLRARGVHVVRPETLALPDQIQAYREAARLIAAEGSALHTLQLTGRIGADVTVFVRRPGHRLAEASLQPRVRSLTYAEVTQGLVHGLRPTGGPALAIGISILDEQALLDALARQDVRLAASWRSADYIAERDQDVVSWLVTEARAPRAKVPGAGDAIAASLRGSGMDHLADTVPAILAEPRRVQRRSRLDWARALLRR